MQLAARWLWDAVLVAAIVAALILIGGRGRSPGVEIAMREPPPGVDELRVDVEGAVGRPGVVTAAPGDRVTDVLALAGGPAADADTLAINLSRRVVDEDHVVVPRASEHRAPLLDLNAATAPELEALPGIGKVTASAILASRGAVGPFAATDDLVARGIVTARVYEQVRDLVTVH